MSDTINGLDRLRIERLVWSLDQQLYDLPRAQRVATRREVRANLREAARDVGTAEALRRVGGSRRLAQQYLIAEFGDRPRHSWIGAAYAAVLVPLVLDYFLGEAGNAFQSGVTAADPHATGTYVWSGVSWLQSTATYTFSNGTASSHGGAWTPFTYLVWLVVTIAGGRLWRLRFRRRAAAGPA
ncbi:hypothetical protein [Krasilnikovia sp. MM14-A1004]|uniref:hypothetical protein n=1 Tax=Krasilnikovia sp. MM14-A1004 TaxID=3373541 RepID=UPI00399CB391